MEAKSSLLIIVDDDLSYGINQGYYPDMTKAIDLGNLTVCPLSNVDNLKEHDIQLSAQPIGEGEDVYFRNPYANCYVSMKDSDLLNTFVETKSYAIKEALILMGAKDIGKLVLVVSFYRAVAYFLLKAATNDGYHDGQLRDL